MKNSDQRNKDIILNIKCFIFNRRIRLYSLLSMSINSFRSSMAKTKTAKKCVMLEDRPFACSAGQGSEE